MRCGEAALGLRHGSRHLPFAAVTSSTSSASGVGSTRPPTRSLPVLPPASLKADDFVARVGLRGGLDRQTLPRWLDERLAGPDRERG
jgi:hypothetical protein